MKNARNLPDTKLEMEVISQCGSGRLGDYKPSRANMAQMKLEGRLGVVENSRITVPDSVLMLMVEQPKLGIILDERVVEHSVPELKGPVSFDCGSWDGRLKTSLVITWELMKPSWCPHPNAGLIWDTAVNVTLDLDDGASLHD